MTSQQGNGNAIAWHDAEAKAWDEHYATSGEFKERYRQFSSAIGRFATADGTAIDLGCGTGVFSFQCATISRHVLGFDGSARMIEVCNEKAARLPSQRGTLAFHCCDLFDVPRMVRSEADLVVASSLLEYIDELPRSLELCRRLLRPGGVLVFSLANRDSWHRYIERLSYRVVARPSYFGLVKTLVTRSTAEETCRSVGFEVLESAYFGATRYLPRAVADKARNEMFLIVARAV